VTSAELGSRESSCKVYTPQAKILTVRTNIWERIFEVISNERSPNRVLTLEKVLRKCVPKRSFGHPKSSFGEHKVVTKDNIIPENQHIACCDYLCNHLVKLLQKIIASESQKIVLLQRSATHHLFGTSEMSAWLGQCYHYFDEISRGLGNIIIIDEIWLLFRKLDNRWTTLRGLKLCRVF
jgi:hypothetical protein